MLSLRRLAAAFLVTTLLGRILETTHAAPQFGMKHQLEKTILQALQDGLDPLGLVAMKASQRLFEPIKRMNTMDFQGNLPPMGSSPIMNDLAVHFRIGIFMPSPRSLSSQPESKTRKTERSGLLYAVGTYLGFSLKAFGTVREPINEVVLKRLINPECPLSVEETQRCTLCKGLIEFARQVQSSTITELRTASIAGSTHIYLPVLFNEKEQMVISEYCHFLTHVLLNPEQSPDFADMLKAFRLTLLPVVPNFNGHDQVFCEPQYSVSADTQLGSDADALSRFCSASPCPGNHVCTHSNCPHVMFCTSKCPYLTSDVSSPDQLCTQSNCPYQRVCSNSHCPHQQLCACSNCPFKSE